LNEKYKNFIVEIINSTEQPYLKKVNIVAAMVQEFGITHRSASIHIGKFRKEHCDGADRLAYWWKISKHREIFSKDDVWDDHIKYMIIPSGSTRFKMRKLRTT